MAENDTLLVRLSPWFTNRTEEVVTEALGFIFEKSPASREGLDDVVRSGVSGVAPVSKVLTQKQDWGDGTRPDLVGMDEGNTERVLIEAKFRADLTNRQPNAYLDRLPEHGPSVLMFVVPEDRISSLWPTLRRRAERGGKKLSDIDGERKCVRVDDTGRHLMVVSWTGLLDTIAAKTREAGESSVESDIQQLRGLARYGEDRTFSPIRESGEDYGPDSRRARDLKNLIDQATDRGTATDWLSRRGLNRTPRSYGYGRYIRLSNTEVWFGINGDLWKENGETPLWVEPYPAKGVRLVELWPESELYGPAKSWIPIRLEKEVEFEECLEDVLNQLKSVADAL